jgi:hypothetical protein
MAGNVIEYQFIPLPFYDKEDGQYKPSVKVLVNGQFDRWTVFELGFDEPKFTMPYARQFALETKAIYESSFEFFKKQFNV